MRKASNLFFFVLKRYNLTMNRNLQINFINVKICNVNNLKLLI